MAGATRRASRKQPSIAAFGRITKVAAVAPADAKAKLLKTTTPTGAPAKQTRCVAAGTKRKYDEPEAEGDSDIVSYFQKPIPKKVKVHSGDLETETCSQASLDEEDTTSPVSSQTPCSSVSSPLSTVEDLPRAKPILLEDLPQTLKDILSLHQAFLKSLSIHYAHNGLYAPAEVTSLTDTITSVWKKFAVRKEDIQRMLAIYELSDDNTMAIQSGSQICHKSSPFKLTVAGRTNAMRTCVEYVGNPSLLSGPLQGQMHSPFNKQNLQCLFKLDLVCLYRASQDSPKTHLAFLDGPLSDFPLLACNVGVQSAMRQEITSARRSEIIKLSAEAQSRQAPKSFSSVGRDVGVERDSGTLTSGVSWRTKLLFERVSAKAALASSTNITTPESILRRHAIGHICEIIHILRMKQQQKSTRVGSLVRRDSDEYMNSTLGTRTSFSMGQLLNDIKNSVSGPIGEEEIRVSLRILANEDITKAWVRIVDNGRMQCVVLEGGEGIVGKVVQQTLEQQEKCRND